MANNKWCGQVLRMNGKRIPNRVFEQKSERKMSKGGD
jgi:hypothetical protein